MFKRILLFLLLLAGPSWGASTITTTQPQSGQPYNSTVIRNNFQAAANDVNALQLSNIGNVQPFPCNLANGGRWWIDNTLPVWVYKTCDGPGTQWVPAFSIDTANNTALAPSGLTPPRAVLAGDITMYVAPSGVDTGNTCLVQAQPCQTVQRPFTLLMTNYDLAGHNATVQLASGTYTTGVNIGPMIGQNGNSTVSLIGNSQNPDSVIIADLRGGTFGNSIFVTGGTTNVTVQGLKLQAGFRDLWANRGATIEFQNVDFGTAGECQIASDAASYMTIAGNYSITGGAAQHMCAFSMGVITEQFQGTSTVSVSGNPAFTNFVLSQDGSINTPGVTFTGTATGTRYTIFENGVVFTGTNNVNYFPGNAPGNLTSGGQYDNTVAQRIRLLAPLTLYVSTTGSDSNNCTVQTLPCATIQNAFNLLQANYDLGGQTATVQLADGTYNQIVTVLSAIPGQYGAAQLILQGDVANPDATVLAPSSACVPVPPGSGAGGIVTASYGGEVQVQDLKITSNAGNAACNGLYAYRSGILHYANIDFGSLPGGSHLIANQRGEIYSVGNSTISGSAGAHISCLEQGDCLPGDATFVRTYNLVNTPAFGNFVAAGTQGQIYCANCVFTGSGATGPRYSVTTQGQIQTGGTNNANFFPGSSAGTADGTTFGLYN